jgi:hypothetical protein
MHATQKMQAAAIPMTTTAVAYVAGSSSSVSPARSGSDSHGEAYGLTCGSIATKFSPDVATTSGAGGTVGGSDAPLSRNGLGAGEGAPAEVSATAESSGCCRDGGRGGGVGVGDRAGEGSEGGGDGGNGADSDGNVGADGDDDDDDVAVVGAACWL